MSSPLPMFLVSLIVLVNLKNKLKFSLISLFFVRLSSGWITVGEKKPKKASSKSEDKKVKKENSKEPSDSGGTTCINLVYI